MVTQLVFRIVRQGKSSCKFRAGNRRSEILARVIDFGLAKSESGYEHITHFQASMLVCLQFDTTRFDSVMFILPQLSLESERLMDLVEQVNSYPNLTIDSFPSCLGN